MDNVRIRLDKACKIGDYRSRREMCKKLEIPYSTLNKWVDKDHISANGILKITNHVNISRSYLESGKGEAEQVDLNSLAASNTFDNAEFRTSAEQIARASSSETSVVDISEEELIALLPKDQQLLIKSYRKLSDNKKKEHRDKLIIEAAEAEFDEE